VVARVQYAPYRLAEGAWDGARRQALGDLTARTLAEHLPGLGGLPVREVLAPPDLEARYGVTEGHLYHGELTLDQALFMRPVPGWSRYRTPIEGLYLCGPGTHPGGGILGGPGRNAAREIQATKGR
jgi:phytoene dehydrogenase-like protein